jgi:peptidoglycan/xylan/chitin deacetylase (PgdA/CDA1 family)
VDGNGVINAADVTLLRAYLAATDQVAFRAANPHFKPENADANGDGIVNSADVTQIRHRLAASNPASVRLGRPPGYFINVTYDDGPRNEETLAILNHLRTLNDRNTAQIKVVCGRNGVHPCTPAVGYGLGPGTGPTACGNQSRALVSFYVMVLDMQSNADALMRRMLEEGHSIDNHTTNHSISTGASRSTIETQISGCETRINTAANGTRDFYGNTYNTQNPHRTFAFRPNQFTIGNGSIGIDTAQNRPWMFAWLDADDWRGHNAALMAHWLINGQIRANGVAGCPDHPPGGAWCTIREANYPGAPEGGGDGAIVLFHDGGGTRTQTAAAPPLFIPQMQAMGYHFVTTEQMFTYMDAEWAWIDSVANIRPGAGDGTRVNDRVIRNQGNYAAWVARAGNLPNGRPLAQSRIYRDGGNRPPPAA